MMDWRRLLSARRLADEAPDPLDPARSPFQKDFDRIVFCSAFRRLQDKTQVHPLAENDYVRTRLTHSLEVASVGRSLGAGVGHVIAGRRRLPAGYGAAEFGHIVSAACLAHDIGNPPFGHRGEHLIRDWFRDSNTGRMLLSSLTEAQRQDILRFEGNAQGFRILTRLQNWRDAGGLQLTAATLGTFTKYPAVSDAEPGAHDDAGGRKFGIMQSEAGQFTDLVRELGLLPAGRGRWVRHPLAFLVEAADDICYTIVDLEDGYKLGRISFEEAEALLTDVAGPLRRYAEIDETARKIGYLRAKAIGELIGEVITLFLDAEPQLLDGKARRPLLDAVPAGGPLRRIAAVCETRVYHTADDYKRELGADKVINTLLEETARGSMDIYDPYARVLAITDRVSGMTDSYAIQQYRNQAISSRLRRE